MSSTTSPLHHLILPLHHLIPPLHHLITSSFHHFPRYTTTSFYSTSSPSTTPFFSSFQLFSPLHQSASSTTLHPTPSHQSTHISIPNHQFPSSHPPLTVSELEGFHTAFTRVVERDEGRMPRPGSPQFNFQIAQNTPVV